jgi:hypothetical protein
MPQLFHSQHTLLRCGRCQYSYSLELSWGWDDVVVTIPSNPFTLDKVAVDINPPRVNITNPPYPPTLPFAVPTEIIRVNGTASDAESGIQKIEAFIDKFPFDQSNQKNKTLVLPGSTGNWSKWSLLLHYTSPGFYRLSICALDYAANQNCDELTINVPLNETWSNKTKGAFVDPIFTHTAYYSNNGLAFYDFYFKYSATPVDVKFREGPQSTKKYPDLNIDPSAKTLSEVIFPVL